MIAPFNVLNVVDYGDAPVEMYSAERTAIEVRRMVREISEAGTIPVVVGGDHSLMYAIGAGLADHYGKGKVGVVHFDAHYDAIEKGFGHYLTHGSPVRRLIDEGHVRGKNYIQVGLRGYAPDEKDLKWMREQGIRYHFMAEVEKKGWERVMHEVLEEAREGTKYLYVSVDVDALDPVYIPGTGTPEPGGLTTREMFPLIRGLCAQNRIVGFDLVELNPLVDPTYVSALNANRILREALTGMAMNKKGYRDPYYLDEKTVDHD
jgi:agmatinase